MKAGFFSKIKNIFPSEHHQSDLDAKISLSELTKLSFAEISIKHRRTGKETQVFFPNISNLTKTDVSDIQNQLKGKGWAAIPVESEGLNGLMSACRKKQDFNLTQTEWHPLFSNLTKQILKNPIFLTNLTKTQLTLSHKREALFLHQDGQDNGFGLTYFLSGEHQAPTEYLPIKEAVNLQQSLGLKHLYQFNKVNELLDLLYDKPHNLQDAHLEIFEEEKIPLSFKNKDKKNYSSASLGMINSINAAEKHKKSMTKGAYLYIWAFGSESQLGGIKPLIHATPRLDNQNSFCAVLNYFPPHLEDAKDLL